MNLYKTAMDNMLKALKEYSYWQGQVDALNNYLNKKETPTVENSTPEVSSNPVRRARRRLNKSTIGEIKWMLKNTDQSVLDIAEATKTSYATVYRIRSGKIHKNVKPVALT